MDVLRETLMSLGSINRALFKTVTIYYGRYEGSILMIIIYSDEKEMIINHTIKTSKQFYLSLKERQSSLIPLYK